MSADERAVGEDELQAYVDERLEPERRPAVEAYLAEHPEEAARIADYRRHSVALRAALDDNRAGEIPERLVRAAHGMGSRRRWPHLANVAAAVLVLAVGLGGGWALRGVIEPGEAPYDVAERDLVHQAAAAHRVYTVEVRHPVEVRAEEAHLIGWLSKRVGAPLRAPDLKQYGYRLVGGRLLPAETGAAAQLMYEDGAGRRVTAYLRANPGGTETAFRFAEENGLAAFYWLDGPLGYALVGSLERAELLTLAHAVYGQMER